MSKVNDDGIIYLYITTAEDERTAIAKQDSKNARRITINAAHTDNHQNQSQIRATTSRKECGLCLGHHSTHAGRQVHT